MAKAIFITCLRGHPLVTASPVAVSNGLWASPLVTSVSHAREAASLVTVPPVAVSNGGPPCP
jgi:hypothetical protein